MTSPTTMLDRIQALDGDELAEFLAALWQRAGWEVDEAGTDTTAVAVGRSVDGALDRTVLCPVSSSGVASVDDITTAVNGEHDGSADQVMVVSTTGFTPDARRLTDAYGVDTMGSEGLARIVVALGADDLFDRPRSTDGETSQTGLTK